MKVFKYKQGLANDSILLAVVRCLSYASSFAQTMIMSRAFSKFEYGRYSQACLIVTFLSPFLLLGLSNAVNYFYNQEGEKRDEYVETIFNGILILGFSGGIGIILFHDFIAGYFKNLTLVVLIYIVAFRPLLQNLIAMFQVLYISSNKAVVIVVRNTILALVQFVIAVIAAYCLKSVELVLIFLVVTDLIQVLVFYVYFSRNIMQLHFGKINTSLLPKILQYALPLALSTMVGTISINMDTLLIGKMMTTEEFATYSNMAKELPFNFLIASFTDVIFPRIIALKARDDVPGLLRIYKKYLEFGLVSTWIMIADAIVCAKDIVLILYSDKYISGIAIFYVYLLVSALRFTYHGMILSAYGKSNKIFIYSVITLVTNFVLNIALFSTMGMIGPAVATFVSVLITMLLQMFDSVKLLKVKIRDIYDFKYLLKVFIETLILILIFSMVRQYLINMPAFIRFLLVYVMFGGIMLLINRKRIINGLKILNKG